MNNMKRFTKLVSFLAIAATIFVGCGDDDDEDTSVLAIDQPAYYFNAPGESTTVGFTARGINGLHISSKPQGWKDITIDEATQTLKITVPQEAKPLAEEGDKEPEKIDQAGTIVLTGTSYAGTVKSANLFVGLIRHEDLSREPANSYIVTKPNVNYTFALAKGDGTPIQAKRVKVLWQTTSTMVRYVTMEDQKVSFLSGMVPDKEEPTLKEGNAVIAAYDENNEIVWSWHIWSTAEDPEANTLHYTNGYEVMNRNLGALASDKSTPEKQHASMGMFYQWGRKDPFVGLSTYKNSLYTIAPMYTEENNRIDIRMVTSKEDTGTAEYATRHPLDYIITDKIKEQDWMWTENNTAWSADRKSVNDPCPAGWRVAPTAAFENLKIASTPTIEDSDNYGWDLSDGTTTSLYMGAGRRVYLTGKIQNIYNPLPPTRANIAEEAQPWMGLYWTADALAERRSSALEFWFEKKTVTGGIRNGVAYGRANGMSVRCVREK